MPHSYVTKQEFKQPIFGSNYLKAYCKTLVDLGNIPQIIFKIWFTSGGTGTFVPAFLNIIANVKKNLNKGPDTQYIDSLASGAFKRNAYIDPNDPSVILIEAPQVSYIINFIGE